MAGIQKVTEQHIADVTVNVPPIASQFDNTADSNDKSFVVPNNELWYLNFAHVSYTSTATAGNRQLIMEILDADGNMLIDMHAGTVQAAGLERHYGFMQGVYRETAFVDASLQTPFPKDLYLAAGYTLRFYDKADVDSSDDMTVSFQYQKFTV